jgi:hypothetical protein
MTSRRACTPVVLGALLIAGCDCGREEGDPVYYDGGRTDPTGLHYESASLYGTWLHFPGGRRYRMRHELVDPPSEVLVYLAFREDPLREGEPGNVTVSSGNAGLIEANEDHYLQIRNDTCSEYYVRVTAEVVLGLAGAAGAGGAPGTAGTAGTAGGG